MVGPLTITLANIHTIGTENNVVKPLKPIFQMTYT